MRPASSAPRWRGCWRRAGIGCACWSALPATGATWPGIDAELALGDLTDAASLARAAAGCRYVVHVAADYRFWVPDPEAMLRANVEGTLAVMRAAQAAGVERIVHCSSVAALGVTADGTPADETTPTNEADFIGTYKRSKFLAERAVMDLVRQEGLPAVVVNPVRARSGRATSSRRRPAR